MKQKIQILILALMLISFNSSLKSADSLWTKVGNFPSNAIFYDIFFINNNVGFIAAGEGNIYKTIDQGVTWYLTQSNTKEEIYSISFPDSSNGSNNKIGYAVGTKGTLLNTTDQGENWTAQVVNTKTDLQCVRAVSHNFAYVAGNNGLFLKTFNQGASWDSIPTLTKQGIYDFAINTSLIWAVGGDSEATILFSSNSGTKWNIQTKDTLIKTFNSICFPTVFSGWACGKRGSVLHTSNVGMDWEKQNTGLTTSMLNRIKFIDTLNGWAVSSKGEIISTTDGGTTWNQQISGVKTSLNGIHFFDKYNGFAIGFFGTLLKYKAPTSDIETEPTTNTNITQSSHIELYDLLGRSIATFSSYEKLKSEIENYPPPHLIKWRDEKGIFHFEKMK